LSIVHQTNIIHRKIDHHDLGSLQFICYAAAPASAELVRRAIGRFGSILHTGWGGTEAYGLNTHMTPAEHQEAVAAHEERLLSCGRESSFGGRIRILDEAGVDVPVGEVGELCVRAPWMMALGRAGAEDPRSRGSAVRRDGFDGYWTTKIGWASKGRIVVRGYRAEALIRRLDFAHTTYLVIRGELPTRIQARALDAVLRSGLDQAFISSAVPPARFAASAAPEAPAAAIAAGVIAFGSVTGSPRECAEMLRAAHEAGASSSGHRPRWRRSRRPRR
jgi:hypothetical protein